MRPEALFEKQHQTFAFIEYVTVQTTFTCFSGKLQTIRRLYLALTSFKHCHTYWSNGIEISCALTNLEGFIIST